MDPLLVSLFVSTFVVTLTVLLTRTQFPDLPGPGIRDYLPNGKVLPMLRDNRIIVRTLLLLSKKYGDVFQLWFGPVDTLVTSVPADIVQVYSKTETFVRPKAMRAMFESVVPGSVFTLPKQQHLAARGELREKFNYTCLKGFHGSMIEAVDELCQGLTSLTRKGPNGQLSEMFNITEFLSVATFRVITNVAFGFEMTREDRLLFADVANGIIAEMMLDFVGYPVRQALTMFGVRKRLFESKAKADQFCQKFIQKRLQETVELKEARPADLLDAIIGLKDHDMIGITSQTLSFAVGGAHTLYESISWCIYEVCCAPEVASRIRNELESVFGARNITDPVMYEDVNKMLYLKQVWKEVLRLHPPGAFVMRTATEAVTLRGSGVKVPKGGNVLILAIGAQMSSEVWYQPERFLPERWGPEMAEGDRTPPGSYVPFSVGPKNCPGQFFAEYEGLIILASLYRRFELTLACDRDQIKSCSGWVEGARSCVDGSDYDFGVPVRAKLIV